MLKARQGTKVRLVTLISNSCLLNDRLSGLPICLLCTVVGKFGQCPHGQDTTVTYSPERTTYLGWKLLWIAILFAPDLLLVSARIRWCDAGPVANLPFLSFSLYYLQPLNQHLYHYVLSLIKEDNYTRKVKPTGGVIFHK